MDEMLFPKTQKKKKTQHHGKSIMPAYGGCWLCRYLHDDDRPKATEVHHIFFGPNRKISEEYGFTTDLCIQHHRTGPEAVHKDSRICRKLQKACQREFEKTNSRADFVKLIGRSYL